MKTLLKKIHVELYHPFIVQKQEVLKNKKFYLTILDFIS